METPQINISAVEVAKLDLKPGDILALTIKSDDVNRDMIAGLHENLNQIFPNNRVLIFGMGLNDDLKFSTISGNKENSDCYSINYCADCNCGKKEQNETN